MPSLLPFSLNNNPPVVRRLLSFKKNDTNEPDPFSEKAVKSLVKKLRRTGGLDELEKSVTTADPTTQCIKIPRSLDGRLQVSHKKGLPHFIYCQLWRWPDLKSPQELKPIDTCEYAFSLRRDEVCVNPYHYTRIEFQSMPPIIMSSSLMSPSSIANCSSATTSPTSTCDSLNGLPSSINGYTSVSNDITLSCGDSTSIVSACGPGSTFGGSCDSSSNGAASPGNNNGYNSLILDNNTFPFAETPPGYISEDGDNRDTSMGMDTSPSDIIPSCPSSLLYPVSYNEPPFWCSIAYYEHNVRVGEIFQVSNHRVTVDGFTDPSSADRFCLGLLSNVNRPPSVESVRRCIGRGLSISYSGNEVIVECLSESAIFVQSVFGNTSQQWHPAAVVKVPPNCAISVFNRQEFFRILEQYIPKGYESVNSLICSCFVRISFVKGWGKNYQRQLVTATPCWIEVKLHGPLQCLDQILKQMGSSRNYCSSTS